MSEGSDGRGQHEEWTYEAYRVGRATRSVTVPLADGSETTIEEGQLTFDPINAEDQWMWTEESWVDHIVPPGADSVTDFVNIGYEKAGIIEFPRPMTEGEAYNWLKENRERYEQFLDESIQSDTTAEDISS